MRSWCSLPCLVEQLADSSSLQTFLLTNHCHIQTSKNPPQQRTIMGELVFTKRASCDLPEFYRSYDGILILHQPQTSCNPGALENHSRVGAIHSDPPPCSPEIQGDPQKRVVLLWFPFKPTPTLKFTCKLYSQRPARPSWTTLEVAPS